MPWFPIYVIFMCDPLVASWRPGWRFFIHYVKVLYVHCELTVCECMALGPLKIDGALMESDEQ